LLIACIFLPFELFWYLYCKLVRVQLAGQAL